MPTEQNRADPDGPSACQSPTELAACVRLSDEAKGLTPGTKSVEEFLTRLHEERLDVDAMRVLAYSLPIRKSIWWGVLCAWHGENGLLKPEQELALQAAVQWVVEPSEKRGRVAAAMGESRVLEDAGDCCVRAAGVAGRLDGPKGPFVPGEVAAAARLVVAAVFLAYAQRAEKDPRVSYRRFTRLGRLVGEGKIPWSQGPQSRSPR